MFDSIKLVTQKVSNNLDAKTLYEVKNVWEIEKTETNF